eukprot:TRINITY_DN3288_c0_g1_i4.p2 TRINITY_DN3288_c0_g1~~TRINITY_DN3288_c0_g1_i4.p2  ORF type:complete len:210 (-),score=44.60 TRINITY_DN3288_c0_g1_i4:565-1194(-)
MIKLKEKMINEEEERKKKQQEKEEKAKPQGRELRKRKRTSEDTSEEMKKTKPIKRRTRNKEKQNNEETQVESKSKQFYVNIVGMLKCISLFTLKRSNCYSEADIAEILKVCLLLCSDNETYICLKDSQYDNILVIILHWFHDKKWSINLISGLVEFMKKRIVDRLDLSALLEVLHSIPFRYKRAKEFLLDISFAYLQTLFSPGKVTVFI